MGSGRDKSRGKKTPPTIMLPADVEVQLVGGGMVQAEVVDVHSEDGAWGGLRVVDDNPAVYKTYEPEPPVEGFWDCETLWQYHDDRFCDSHSSLEDFIESSQEYHMRRFAGTLPRRPETAAFRLGIALHAWTLQPELFDELVAIEPEVESKRTNEGKAILKEFRAGAGRRTIIDLEEWRTVQAMRDAIRKSDLAGPFIYRAKGRGEQAIRWKDRETGLWLKACFDWLIESGDGLIDINLKTSADPCPYRWEYDSRNLGYHRGTSLYRQGKTAVMGRAGTSAHLVVGSKPPYHVALYKLDERVIQLGDIQNRRALEGLAWCRANNDWRDPWTVNLTEITYPPYALKEVDQYERDNAADERTDLG